MNTFDRETIKHNETIEPETPFLKGRRAWDERMGVTIEQRDSWRLVAYGLLMLCFSLLTFLFFQVQRSTVVPYVVEIANNKNIRVVAVADRLYKPDDSLVATQLAHFIQKFRSKSLDAKVLRKNLKDIFHFLAGDAEQAIIEFIRRDSPFSRPNNTRSITIESVVKTFDSYQVRWTEQNYVNGSLEGMTAYTALLKVRISPPKNRKTLLNNPLGLFITDINWSKDVKVKGGPK